MDSVVEIKSCRICMTVKKPLCPLFKYKLSGNYAEMLTAIADVKVAMNDGLPDRICNKCCVSLEKAFLLKTVAERSDKKLRKLLLDNIAKTPTKKIAFDSFVEVKSEIPPLALKPEPKWDVEVEILDETAAKSLTSTEGQDVVIANTVIRKLDPNNVESKQNTTEEEAQVTWTSLKSDEQDAESLEMGNLYLDFQDDDDDDDYVPPDEKKQKKEKFKKPKLADVKVYKDKNKAVYRKVKVIRQNEFTEYMGSQKNNITRAKSTMITCYPILKNGKRGPPIMLKRPKDATILKIHPNYKPRNRNSPVIRRERSQKPLKSSNGPKPKEKMVCPICGILTFTLGNHMNTHQEKKKFNCSECTKTFSQKNNLEVHMKQHSGVKDHICEVCGAGFYSQKSLVRHNLIHKGERPFACTLCSKTFIARCDLNRHLRIHSGYKPYKCGICTMSFNAKHQLQNHERMHTGERPYSCQICNVAFSYKVNLNNHVFKVHGVNLKFKSIHTVTEEILHKELGMSEAKAKAALAHLMPHLGVPTPGAHETITTQGEY